MNTYSTLFFCKYFPLLSAIKYGGFSSFVQTVCTTFSNVEKVLMKTLTCILEL